MEPLEAPSSSHLRCEIFNSSGEEGSDEAAEEEEGDDDDDDDDDDKDLLSLPFESPSVAWFVN